MIIKAGGGRRYEVFLRGGREKIDAAFAVWALWNGGPGVVGYFPKDVHGHVYLDPSGDRAASAYRIGRVTVRPIDSIDRDGAAFKGDDGAASLFEPDLRHARRGDVVLLKAHRLLSDEQRHRIHADLARIVENAGVKFVLIEPGFDVVGLQGAAVGGAGG